MIMRIFGWSIGVSIVSLIVAFLYGGWTALVLCFLLGILEVSLSFDNAVVNATVLKRMSAFWQKMFLTVGIVIAVFGMRLVFPIAIICIVSGLGPIAAIDLALQKGDPNVPGTFGYILSSAHPQIAGFGGMFLLMLFLNYILDGERDEEGVWIWHVEKFLMKIGALDKASVLIATVVLLISAEFLAPEPIVVLVAGLLGMITYLAVDGIGNMFHPDEAGGGPSGAAVATGKAAFLLFIYLEILDATFSFDGVIGAFAITSDPIIIALGLGLIGAMFVRSITVYLVRQGTLDDYVYLEAGAHWAIGALALILMLTIGIHVNEVITGLVGVFIILAAFVTSIMRNRKIERQKESEQWGPPGLVTNSSTKTSSHGWDDETTTTVVPRDARDRN